MKTTNRLTEKQLEKILLILNLVKEEAKTLVPLKFTGGIENLPIQSDPKDYKQNGVFFEKHLLSLAFRKVLKPDENGESTIFPGIHFKNEPCGNDTFPDFGLMIVEKGERVDWLSTEAEAAPAVAIDAKATTRTKTNNQKTHLCLGSANSFGLINRNRFTDFFILGGVYDPIDDPSIKVGYSDGEDGYKIKPTIKNVEIFLTEESKIMSLTISGQMAYSVGFRMIENLTDEKLLQTAPLGGPEQVELCMELGSTRLSKLKRGESYPTARERAAVVYQKLYKKGGCSKEKSEEIIWSILYAFAEGKFDEYILEQERLGFHSFENLWEEAKKAKFEYKKEYRENKLKELYPKWKERMAAQEYEYVPSR